MELKIFQQETLADLRKAFLDLWKTWKRSLPLVFKAPTWSGKTIMTAQFLKDLTNDPQFEADMCYVWISFWEDLVMQSKKKLFQYYWWASSVNLLDLTSLTNKKKLENNNVFFINWEKIKSSTSDWRKLRRETEKTQWDKWVFDDFILKTREEREIVLIIDEAHAWSKTDLAQEIIDLINPRIIFKITATPSDQEELDARRSWKYIEVERQKVIEEWLIKEKIVTQTKEDLDKISKLELDQDILLLELAYNKRNELVEDYKKLWLNINPLVLIQLPNDDKATNEVQARTKLDIAKEYLTNKWETDNNVAIWLSEKKENLDEVEKNNSSVNFLIFKQAAATWWDCPRASILVMYREIKKPDFHTQTVWRILRMPLWYHFDIPEMNVWYLYTNYERNQVHLPDSNKLWDNKPYIYISTKKDEIDPIILQSTFLWRVDYNDIWWTQFEPTLFENFNEYFGINESDILWKAKDKIKSKWLDIENTKITYNMIIDVEIENYDDFIRELQDKWKDMQANLSIIDIERLYNLELFNFIAHQDQENRKYAPERSWSAVKKALNVWMNSYVSEDRREFYKIIVNDFRKSDSVLKKVLWETLEKYKPIRQIEVQEKEKRSEKKIDLNVPRRETFYTDDYKEFNDFKIQKSATEPFYLPDSYSWRVNEVDFIKYVEGSENVVWWYKNGQSWSQNFWIKRIWKDALFYPDWIAKLSNGKILIVDTKDWVTARDPETIDKADSLQKWIKETGNKNIIWGIVVKVGDIWRVNNKEIYKFDDNYWEFIYLNDLF
ncbi:MAG: Type III restriction enzyme, res subunit family [uncultured bacterium (gcode 4)]|uniref:Type III restriction enzyme, res subunit family n=1 Tax=uncultured bacterium (gcode 4) TaxID=1234023 RepID=K2FZ33_9BACT|nr:MAG: Type III restriction enzyme, res subunit family [uncultured bacterium (gcode 4)]